MDQPIGEKLEKWTARRVILATLIVLGVAFLFWLFLRFSLVAFSLFQAVVFSTAINPSVAWLEKRNLARPLGIVITFIAIALLVIGFVLVTAPLIINQGATLSSTLSDAYTVVHKQLIASPSILINRLAMRFPDTLSLSPTTTPPTTANLDTFAQAVVYLGAMGRAIFATLAVLLLTFYYTLDREKTIRALLMVVPQERRDQIRMVIESTETRVGAYIRGVGLLCLFIGVMAMISYLIIGVPHALLLGVMAGVLEIVPLIGPILGAVPAILVALASDPSKVIFVIIALIVIQFSENHFLVPRVMDKTVGVNPVVSLLAFAAFSSLFGFAGALLAIPMAVLIQILLDRFLLAPDALSQPEPLGRDRISRLRYEAQELVLDVRKQVRVKEGNIAADSDVVEDSIEAIINDLDSILASAEAGRQAGKQ